MEKVLEIRIGDQDTDSPVSEILKRRAGLTRAQIRSAKFRPGGLTADGRQVRSSDRLKSGQVLRVLLEQGQERGCVWTPNPGPLDILYEDEDLIAVDKPAGIVAHPSPGHYGDSLANRLADLFIRRDGAENSVRIRALGRLDKDTSGIMLFAKNQVAAARLQERKVKEYLALVRGCPEKLSGTVSAPVGRAEGQGMKMEVRNDGKNAVTHYTVIQKGKISLIRLCLDTGRTHQIRVHMAYIGCPLLGDRLYGEGGEPGRAALHAFRLTFEQPFTGERIELKSEMPSDMKKILEMQNQQSGSCVFLREM